MARILMIAYTTYVHDARVKRHAQALADRGDHVDLICLENPQQGERGGVNVIGLKLRRYRGSSKTGYFGTYLRFFFAAGIKALQLGLARPYDLAIVCTMPDAAVLCALPLRLLGSKIVLDIHDTMPELYREKFGGRRGALGARLLTLEERLSTCLADRVLAVHELHRQRLASTGVKPRKISVVLNVPYPGIFAATGRRPAPPGFTIICHGTVARRLGLDVALRAMALLRDRLPDAKLVVLGSGDYLPQYKTLTAQLGLTERVCFRPPVPLEQLPAVLRGAAVGLIPNRASSATHLMLPVKLLEYTTLGIPVIAARLRTIEYYFDRSCLRFFEPGDPEDLAGAIEDVYRSPLRRLRLAENASRVMEAINWQTQRECYYAAIDSVLGPSRQSNRSAGPSANDATSQSDLRQKRLSN
jgi:glycosyltransferase involved in cell wall biosynthesis